jgi:hypothetical protein
VRVKALPHDSPLWFILREERDRAEEQQRSAELDDALNRYRPKGATDA